jgi:hypothetical protein
MRRDLFLPSEEGEARLLLLIDAFSGEGKCLEGRTKLAKLDFLLRYPKYLRRALEIRGIRKDKLASITDEEDIETQMVRYKYGPWDPAYYALLGRLIGKQLIVLTPYKRGLGFKVTHSGHKVASNIAGTLAWKDIALRAIKLRQKFDMSGTNLKEFIYDNFPEVTGAALGETL